MAKSTKPPTSAPTEEQLMQQFLQTSGYEPEQEEEDLSQYEEEQGTQFPPYWRPSLGAGFVAKVIDLDARNPEFLRYVLEACSPVKCQMGPSSDNNTVTVQPGQQFTTSVYRSLPLHEYMGLDNPIMVVCVGQIDVKGRTNPMWKFKIRTSTTDHATLAERRAIQGDTRQLTAKTQEAFRVAHTAKDAKSAVKALLEKNT